MKTKLAALVIALGFTSLAALPSSENCPSQPPCGASCHTWICPTHTGCCPNNALCVCFP